MANKTWKLSLACSAAVVALATATTAAAQQRTFNIPAESAIDAIPEFGRQAGVQITAPDDQLSGVRTKAIKGQSDVRQALQELLEGTGLQVISDNGAVIVLHQRGERVVPQPTGAEGPASAPTVDEVIVTASKRAERVHDVPASVTAVTGDSLQVIGAARLEDYVAKIPGLTLSNDSMNNGSNQLTIRGVTTGLGGNPTVGIYIDDSPFGASGGFGAFTIPDLDPQDLARVEVLRGPQGTLYGAGSLGGLLKYVTAMPDFNRYTGRLEVDGSQVDGGGAGYGVRGSANIPINDRLALRVSAYDREDPGFVDDAVSGARNINSGRYAGGRASLAWKVNDDWTVRLSALYQRQHGAGAVVDYDTVTFKPVYGDLEQVRAPGTGVNAQQIGAYDIQVEGNLGWATLTSSTSFDKQLLDFNIDGSSLYGALFSSIFGVPNVGAAIVTDNGLDKFTQEVRLASPATNRLSWQIGGFYTHEHTLEHQTLPIFDVTTGGPLGVTLPALLQASVGARFEELAAFGDVTYHFGPRFDVTGGLRYSHNTQTVDEDLAGLLIGPARSIIVVSGDSSVTYLVTPRFHLNDDTMLYARLASGYRPGGPNIAAGGVPPTYGPDKVTNYEVGVKSDLLDRRLTLDVALYYIDWKNVQVQEASALGIGFQGNAGAAASKGFEASASWRPVQGLEISGELSHTMANLSADLPAGGAVGVDGDPLPLTPRWSGGFGVDYSRPLRGQWNGLMGASYRHVGETQGQFPNPGKPRFVHPAYDVVDLRAGISNERWSLILYAKNVGDTRGQSADSAFGPNTRVSVIQPRTFGASIAATF